MAVTPMHMRQALELRYDGPIPSQHLRTDRSKLRQRRGVLSVLEAQVAEFLDAAERCQNDIEGITADLADPSQAQHQLEMGERSLRSARERSDAHIRAAADVLRQAIPLRSELGLAPHPIVSLMTIMKGS